MFTYVDREVQICVTGMRAQGATAIPIIKELRARYGFDLVEAKRAYDYSLTEADLLLNLAHRRAAWRAALAEVGIDADADREVFDVVIEATAKVALRTTVLAKNQHDALNRADAIADVYAKNDVTPKVWTVEPEPAKVRAVEVKRRT